MPGNRRLANNAELSLMAAQAVRKHIQRERRVSCRLMLCGLVEWLKGGGGCELIGHRNAVRNYSVDVLTAR
jgi:hypothetical protein